MLYAARMVTQDALFSDPLDASSDTDRIVISPPLSPAAAVLLVVENLIIEIRHGLTALRPQIAIESRIASLFT